MSETLLRLHFRFGNEIKDPTNADVEAALAEVFHENNPNLIEGDYVEHPNSWLEYGYETGDDWSVITVDVYRSGAVDYSCWADQDDDEPVVQSRLDAVCESRACDLFQLVLKGRLDQLAAEFNV